MIKICRTLLSRIIRLSSKEIDLMLTLISYADDNSIIRSSHLRSELCYAAGITQPHYYNCLNKLIERSMVSVDSNHNIYIRNNSLKYIIRKGGNGYVNLPSFVFTRTFQRSSVQAKKLLLHLLSTYARKNYIKIKLSKIMEILKLNRPQKARDVLRELYWLNAIDILVPGENVYRQTIIKIALNPEVTVSNPGDNKAGLGVVAALLKSKRIKLRDLTPSVIKHLVLNYNFYKAKFVYYLDCLNISNAGSYGAFLYAAARA